MGGCAPSAIESYVRPPALHACGWRRAVCYTLRFATLKHNATLLRALRLTPAIILPLCLIPCFYGGAPSGRHSRRCFHFLGGTPPAQTASGLVARLAPGFRPPELAPPARVSRSNGQYSWGTPPRSPTPTARCARAGRRPAPPSKRNPSPPATLTRGLTPRAFRPGLTPRPQPRQYYT